MSIKFDISLICTTLLSGKGVELDEEAKYDF